MRKLIIQIPCFNEVESLEMTIRDLPRSITGFEKIETLVIDDGSTDGTAQLATSLGVDHVVSLTGHQGLAKAYIAGIRASVERGANVIVNTDADNQYCADDIEKLVSPILDGKADLVVGTRPIATIKHFSPVKRLLQRFGSWVVRKVSRTAIADTTSGFRAVTRDAACRMNVFSGYTYTLETIIQAGLGNLRVVGVPIRINGPTRPSRLIRATPIYIARSIWTIISLSVLYRPVHLFGIIGIGFLTPALVLAVRFVLLAIAGESARHLHSVVVCGILVAAGLLSVAAGILAYLCSVNRRMLEELAYRQRSQHGPLDRLRNTSPRFTHNLTHELMVQE